MATLVWQTAFVYKGNIRGYVPAGITGMKYLAVAGVAVALYMGIVARRRNSGGYVAGGCLGAPVALLVTSLFTGVLIRVVGYSLRADIAVSSVCGALCLGMAFMFHWKWLRRGVDQ
jgi:hypothetical protein